MCSGQLCLLIDADPSEVPTYPQTLGDRAAIYLDNYISKRWILGSQEIYSSIIDDLHLKGAEKDLIITSFLK